MAEEVTNYHILVYGSKDGYLNNRAQITLYGSANNVLAYLRFKDNGMPFENDYSEAGIIRMHLPSEMFKNVLDILRNEKPMYIYFAQNRGFLSSSKEPVGEGE
jgi:hypothetical protein